MVKKIFKKGFTLAEALVVLLVLSVFFGATAKVMTKKRPSEVATYQHGYYECWFKYDNDKKHYYRYTVEGIPGEVEEGTSCKFTPSITAALYQLYLVYPHSGDTTDANDERGYYMTSIADISQKLDIKYVCTNTGCYGAQFTNEKDEKALYATTASDAFKQYTRDSVTYVGQNILEKSGSFESIQSILKSLFKDSEILKEGIGGKDCNGGASSGIMIIW